MSPGSIFLFGIFVLWLISKLRDRNPPRLHIEDAWQHRRYLRQNGDPRSWRMP